MARTPKLGGAMEDALPRARVSLCPTLLVHVFYAVDLLKGKFFWKCQNRLLQQGVHLSGGKQRAGISTVSPLRTPSVKCPASTRANGAQCLCIRML